MPKKPSKATKKKPATRGRPPKKNALEQKTKRQAAINEEHQSMNNLLQAGASAAMHDIFS